MIETERLLLRKPEPEDADAIYRQFSDAEVMRWIGANGDTGTHADAVERIVLVALADLLGDANRAHVVGMDVVMHHGATAQLWQLASQP